MNVHLGDASPDQEDVRDGLDREVTRRWTQTAREVRRSILMHDALGIGDKAPQAAMPTGDKAEQFRRWLNERLSIGVGGYDGSWLETFVNRASTRGTALGDAQMGLAFLVPAGPAPSSKACHGAAVMSLAGICEDVSDRAHASVARGLLAKAKPRQIAGLVDQAMGHGLKRSRALAEHSVTQAFTQASLDALEASGVTHVGTLSERRRRRGLRDADALLDAEISLEDFDPDEPRDESGRWSPTKSIVAYKQFEKRGDELHPLFIGKTRVVPQGQWIKATFDPTKGYAARPGWHAGVLPIAPHLRTHAGKIKPSRVWAEVELPADVDYQSELDRTGQKDIKGHVPEGGYYRFKRAKMQGSVWLIGGGVKVNRTLSDPEVREILTKKGFSKEEIAGEMHDGLVDFDPDQPRNDLGEWTASYSGRKGKYDPAFFSTEDDPLEDEHGVVVGNRQRLVPTRAASERPPIVDDPSLMYRGMSSGEYEAFKASGSIQTAGSHNLSNQAGLTYFTTESRAAETYANAFAPWQYKPDFDKPAYVVVAKRAAPERLRHIEGTGEHELGVVGPVDKSEVTEVWRGKVIARDPGEKDRLAPSARLHWEKLKHPLADWLEDAPRKTPQPKHPRSGKFAKAHVVARESRRSKRTGKFGKQGLSAEAQRKEELAEARFGRVEGRLDVLTAGDDRVCDICDGISENGPYSINEARGLIPAHPNCRCVFVAAGTMKDAWIEDFDPSEPRDPLGMWTKTAGITAYHGSGHEFSQFGMEHVGEGEGSQVYGHGLYLAEEPSVSETYKTAGLPSFTGWTKGGQLLKMTPTESTDYMLIAPSGPTLDKAIEGLSTAVDQVKWALGKGSTASLGAQQQGVDKLKRLESNLALAKQYKAAGYELGAAPEGNLYQVKIHATPDEFLDWDKPLSQQSKLVQDYVKNRDLGGSFKAHLPGTDALRFDPTGEQMMQGFIGMGPKGAERLRAAGIKGVRYLDQFSRERASVESSIRDWEKTRQDIVASIAKKDQFYTEGNLETANQKLKEFREKLVGLPHTNNYVIVDPAIIEITHHNGKPLTKSEAHDALVQLVADYDPDEPRDESGRWTASGSITPSSVHSGGEEFVSPSVESGLSFGGAKAALEGPRQAAMLKVSDEIDGALGLKETARSVIGAWADGAENSVLATLPQASWDEIRLSAAMKGYVGDQKAVLAFKQDDDGPAFMYEMHAKGSLDDIHQRLLKDGLAFHTLAPTSDGADVYVADLDGTATGAVQKAAEDFHANATYQRGKAEFIGTQLETGSDRAIRDDARRNYEGVIQQSPVSGGAEVWGRNRDRWSQALAGVRAKELAAPDEVDEVLNRLQPPPIPADKQAAWAVEVGARVAKQFDADGYPQRHIDVLAGTDANKLMGVNYNTLAQYNPHTGKIQFFAETMREADKSGAVGNTVEGTAAHEIQHAKTDWWMKMNPTIERKMKDRLDRLTTDIDKPLGKGFATPWALSNSDGVTPYSEKVWHDWRTAFLGASRKRKEDSKARGLPFDLPFGETISEMRAVERETGKLPGAPEWQNIYHAIEEEWKRGHENIDKAGPRNPRLVA